MCVISDRTVCVCTYVCVCVCMAECSQQVPDIQSGVGC